MRVRVIASDTALWTARVFVVLVAACPPRTARAYRSVVVDGVTVNR